MDAHEPVNILLVDDQPGKLLSYEAILADLGENLIQAGSAREALAHLLSTEIAVVLMDVNMPEMNGFALAAMIRQHPRYQQTAILFISGVHLTDLDILKGYEYGAVDYLTVPIVPPLLRAKVRVFADLYRKTVALRREIAERQRLEHAAKRAEHFALLGQLAQIFEPLYTTKPEGTGLGLYIAREIITAHAGEMTAQSAEGHGTIFTMTLPRALA